MPTLTAPLKESENYNKIVEALQDGSFSVLAEGCAEAQKLHMIYSLYRESSLSALARFRLIVTYSDQRAREIKEAFRFYDKNTVLFPAKDLIFYQADLRGRELDTERIRCLRRIMEGSQTTVVTTFSALMTPQVPLDVLQKSVIEVRKGGELSLTETAERLVYLGYEKQYQVEKPGQFAIRGGILDIYDLTEDNPVRIELWGDEVEEIHSFDVLSQRSIAPLSKVTVYPATEMILSDDKLKDGFERILKEEKKADLIIGLFHSGWEGGITTPDYDDNGRSMVIAGGSVLGTTMKASPRPVDEAGNELYAVVISNLTPNASAVVSCLAIPETYSTDGLVADEAGRICIWLAPTNHSRVLTANGLYYTTPYPYQTYSNGVSTVYKQDVVAVCVGDPPDGIDIEGETRYCVTVPGLTPETAMAVEGNIPEKYLVGPKKSDKDGNLFLYLPDGNYEFTVEGKSFVALVAGAATTAPTAPPCCTA